MPKDMVAKNSICRTRAQRMYSSGTNVAPLNVSTVDYVMVQSHEKQGHRSYPKLRGPVRIKEAEPDFGTRV